MTDKINSKQIRSAPTKRRKIIGDILLLFFGYIVLIIVFSLLDRRELQKCEESDTHERCCIMSEGKYSLYSYYSLYHCHKYENGQPKAHLKSR